MTTPPTFPEYKGPKPRPPANPLIAVHAIGEHATAITHLDLRDGPERWTLSFGLDTQPLIAALMQCPDCESWIAPYEAHLNAHSLVPIKGWRAPTVAPNDSPLVLVEKLRGRTLQYQVARQPDPKRDRSPSWVDSRCCRHDTLQIKHAFERAPVAARVSRI